ncbi:MAG: Protein of unknown function, rane YfhO [Gemmatimonadetes bacterium]|nr:Protein of unknown function, rane YfhO [Gemmatimonadota bacterium]
MGWAALVYGLATLMLAYPALSGQFLVNPHSDQYMAGYAFRDFAAQALRAGHSIPQWNPYMFGGLPYVAAMHGDIFYPTALLRVLLPTDVAMTWGFIIHTVLAGLFTYGFLRAWGLGFYASLIGGLGYLLSGPIASYVAPGHDGKLFVSALLPLALWILVRGIRDARLWAWGAFAIVVGLGTLSPHPQLLQYSLLTSGAFALYVALTANPGNRKAGMQRLGFALVAVIIGLAIGGIQYAPVREYVAWSSRTAKDYGFATSYSFPLIELFNIYLPQFTGGEMNGTYWGPNLIHFHSEYIGGTILLLASLASGGDSRKGFRRFWMGVVGVSFLWMLGGSTPFFKIIYALVPGTKFFRAPSTILYVFSLGLSVLAALGTERLLARAVNRKVVYGWLAAGAVVALLATVGVLASVTESAARGIGTRYALDGGADMNSAARYSEMFVQKAVANRGDLLLGAWRAFLFLAIAGGAMLAYTRNAINARVLTIVLVVVVGLDLWSVERKFWMFSAPAKVLYAPDAAIDLLKKEAQPGRVLVLALGDSGIHTPDPYFGNDLCGKGTGLFVHGIRSVTGYHGNELGRYDQLMGDCDLRQGPPPTFSQAFWAHENVRYLYTNAALPDSQFKLLIGPIKNAAGSTVYLYRLPGDNPYAWVAAGATKAPDATVQQAVTDPRFDPMRLAVLSDTNPVPLPPVSAMPAPLGITTSTSNLAAGHASIALSQPSPRDAALVVAENYYPGWSAMVDGKAQPVYRADFNLIGVLLPPGSKNVELSFRDAAVGTGKVLTLLALAVALMALIGGIMVDRRRLA